MERLSAVSLPVCFDVYVDDFHLRVKGEVELVPRVLGKAAKMLAATVTEQLLLHCGS